MKPTTTPTPGTGLHSEVGRLRKVIVCRPGLAQKRLTPANCHELLFDDVLWVARARNDHDAFTVAMKERDIQVLELHDLLAETLNSAEARKFVLDRTITENAVGTAAAAHFMNMSSIANSAIAATIKTVPRRFSLAK